MQDIIQGFFGVIDAPLEVILAGPIGVLTALHFASDPSEKIKGARVDSIVHHAKAVAKPRPRWIKSVGISLGLTMAIYSFVYIGNPNFGPTLLNNLPF